MLNSRILVGISLAVWNSFAAYQVARSTANGAMGDPKTYGYGLAFTTGLTALWIWSGIIKDSERTSGKNPGTMKSKLSPTLLAMEKAKWRSIIGMDFYTEGVWEMIQKEEAIAQKKGKQVSVAKIKKKAAAIEAARVKKIQEELAIAEKNKKKSVSKTSTSTSKSAEDSPEENKKDLDPDYVPPSPAFVTGSNLRFPRKITINYGMNQERSVDITVPADLKYDGIAEEGVIGSSSGEHPSKKVILGLAFLRETSQGTYYPFVLRVNGVGRDFKTAADALEYNLKFILNAQPWNDSGDIPIDTDQDGTFDLIQDPAGNIKKPWWTTKEAENKLPEVPWNLEYVPNAKLSHDSWAVKDMATLEKEIRQNKHTNQFMQVGCPVCGSVNEFFRNVSNNGIRYNCMDCMYTSGDHYVSLKSRGDKTLADFGMTTLCGVCGDTIHAYTNSQFQRHMDKHKSEKVSESETSSGKIMNSESNDDMQYLLDEIKRTWYSNYNRITEYVEHTMAGDGLMAYWNMDYLPNGVQIDENTTKEEYFEKMFQSFYERFAANAQVSTDERGLEVVGHRILYVPVGTKINTESLGNWENRKADQYGVFGNPITSWLWSDDIYTGVIFGDDSIDHMEGIEGKDFDRIVLAAWIKWEAVDWASTIAFNISGFWQECELCVFDKEIVYDLDIYRNGNEEAILEKAMNAEDNYEKTYGRAGARIRRKIKKDLMEENIFGTKSGQWSARKSQELKKRYEAAMKAKGLKPYRTSKKSKSQKDLSQWTKQDWTTASGNKSSKTGEPYFPAKAVAALKKAKLYKKAKAQKRRATAAGKQYARYSPDIQAIVANYRGEQIHEN